MSSDFTNFLDSSDSTEKREIGNVIILFLAYEGVNQPEFWETWKNKSSYPENITFVVHSPEDPKTGKDFCEKYNIGFYNPNTNWCGSSLIYVFLQNIGKIVDKCASGKSYDPSKTCIYLVSGSDIPIVPADALFGLVSLQKNGMKNYQPYDSKICHIKEVVTTNKNNKYTYKIDAQWLALNLKDAKALYTIMIKNQVFYYLKQKWLEDLQKSKNMIRCPDNHFISTAISWNKELWLQAGGNEKTFDRITSKSHSQTCITADPRSGKAGPSPVLWNGQDDVVYVYGDSCWKTNVERVIQVYRLFDAGNERTFFFRKVGSNVNVVKDLEYYIDPSTSYNDIYNKVGASIGKPIFNFKDLSDSMTKHECLKSSLDRVKEFNSKMMSIYSIRDEKDIISIISYEKQYDEELQLRSFQTDEDFQERAKKDKTIQRYIDMKKIT
jgi:hypothetical protein